MSDDALLETQVAIRREPSQADGRVRVIRPAAEGERRLARSVRRHEVERRRLRALVDELADDES